MVNRLKEANSLYLLQHADNPVDWYPWGNEALQKAAYEDKPIFLSIGYAACHWCHVMAHESFEHEGIARILNEHFISIKVDRELRPDLDHIYMNAVVSLTGHGGWPLSVFLSPDGKPFFGGTYFPPVRRYNMPSFEEVLLSVVHAWETDRHRIDQIGQQLSISLSTPAKIGSDDRNWSQEDLDQAEATLISSYDWEYGGWGNAPKFPQPMAIEFLLRRVIRGKTKEGENITLKAAVHALRAMAKGGMYDVVGGGFARYSTDNHWLVPHFEKMLYDNALLIPAYVHAYLLAGDNFFKTIALSTATFISRELTHSSGGFFSSLDADSEGLEGKYYTWSLKEISNVLKDKQELDLFTLAFGVTQAGNFEGVNVLQRLKGDDELANDFQLTSPQVFEMITKSLENLRLVRETRVKPAIDDKVLVVWNCLAVLAFLEIWFYLGDLGCLKMAMRNLNQILNVFFYDGRLHRSWRDGHINHDTAYLEDYASLILALLAAYQADHQIRWYQSAFKLTEQMIALFKDPNGGFFDTSVDHESLIIRPKDLQDSATPSGNSLASTALFKMSLFTGRMDWKELAHEAIGIVKGNALRYPLAFSNWLCAIDLALSNPQEIAIVGSHSNLSAFSKAVWSAYRPNLVLAACEAPIPAEAPPLLANRTTIGDKTTAYVCRNFVCQMPVTNPEDLQSLLQ